MSQDTIFIPQESQSVCIKMGKPLVFSLDFFKPKVKVVHYIVYKITNLVNNKFYIGAHKQKFVDPYKCDNYWSSSDYVHDSIKKHGIENFKRETIEVCKSWKEALKREIYWIAELKSNICRYPDSLGMNRNDGGWGGDEVSGNGKGKDHPNYGRKHTEESKQKMSESQKGKIISEETKAKISKANKGRIVTNETKQKLSLAKKGKKNSEEHKKNIKQNHARLSGKDHHFYGKKHKDSTKKKMSENHYDNSGYNCFLNKYIYTVSNGEDYWTFYTKMEREAIKHKFNKLKIDTIIYKGITITRVLKSEKKDET